MQFAVNYSYALLDLVQAGHAHVDLYKCPAWGGFFFGRVSLMRLPNMAAYTFTSR